MTTSPSSELPSRLVRFFIDADGKSYGDEMERLRYYEAHSAVFQMQTVLSLGIGAFAMAVSSEETANVVYWVVLLPLLANFIALAYLKRQRVRVAELTHLARRRPQFWLFALAALVFVAIRAVKWAVVSNSSDFAGFAVGAAVTFAFVVVVGRVAKRREAKRETM